MKKINQLNAESIQFVFTDIDDTLTVKGKVLPEAFTALWRLKRAGLKVVLVTGRPAGWCDALTRQWPVDAVVGENGGFYFFETKGKLHRRFVQSPDERKKNRRQLHQIWRELKSKHAFARRASDQFTRKLDLAVDICEDDPHLTKEQSATIMKFLSERGLHVKLSSIHINAWFGDFDKASTCLLYLKERWDLDREAALSQSLYCGDSPNDEPLFEIFPHSVGVQNVKNFLGQMNHPPQYITENSGGLGFAEMTDVLLQKN